MLNNTQVAEFKSRGYTIVDSILMPETANHILSIVDQLACSIVHLGNDEQAEITKGQNYLGLVKKNRRDAGKIFDTLVKIPLVNQICYSKDLQNIAEQLLDSNLVLSSPTQMNLRADHPEEKRFLYPWHTDYMYNFSSVNSLVFWIPLQDVDNINGCLHLIPSSHKLSPELGFGDLALAEKQSAGYFTIKNIDEILENTKEVRCPLKLGQAIVFHAKLLHKSGENLSSNTRYAIQSRWFDATSEDAIVNRFIGGIDEGIDPRNYLNTQQLTVSNQGK